MLCWLRLRNPCCVCVVSTTLQCKGPLNPNFFTAVLAFECKWWFKGRMVVPHTRKGHLVETAGVAVDQPQRLLGSFVRRAYPVWGRAWLMSAPSA